MKRLQDSGIGEVPVHDNMIGEEECLSTNENMDCHDAAKWTRQARFRTILVLDATIPRLDSCHLVRPEDVPHWM